MNRAFLSILAGVVFQAAAQTNPPALPWPSKALTLRECQDIAIQQNPTIQKSWQEVEAATGQAMQLRSTYGPKVRAVGAYTRTDTGRIETVDFGQGPVRFQNDQAWNAQFQLVQPVFAGGKLKSASRQAKLTSEIALAQHQAVASDVILQVRTAFEDILLAGEQIGVQESSIRLLEQELTDTRRRFDSGVTPRFNVLRAEVALANAQPPLIRARNAVRNAKNSLANLLGWKVPVTASGTGDIPLELQGKLEYRPVDLDLAGALARAQHQRAELKALRLAEQLREEGIITAKADFYPQLSAVASYGWQNRVFSSDISREVHGWNAGAQLNWEIFNSGLRKGQIKAAEARKAQARIETDDVSRKIDLEVRTSHLGVIEAREVLESQSRVIEQAEEALRLANSRVDAGSGTQLDVLTAQTALTQTRMVYSTAVHDYAVAVARLERAMGSTIGVTSQ